jgi:hypothetical protein
MQDTKVKAHMVDHWLHDGEMWVTLTDGYNGMDERIILAVGKNATTARSKAIKKLKNIIKTLEEMDE